MAASKSTLTPRRDSSSPMIITWATESHSSSSSIRVFSVTRPSGTCRISSIRRKIFSFISVPLFPLNPAMPHGPPWMGRPSGKDCIPSLRPPPGRPPGIPAGHKVPPPAGSSRWAHICPAVRYTPP